MTRDVLVTIRGLHLVDGEGAEPIETVVPGQYFYKNGRHYVIYEEYSEEEKASVTNKVILDRERMRISRGTLSRMEFEEGQLHRTAYQTPYGALMLGIRTSRLQTEQAEDFMEIRAEYELEVEDQTVSHCQLSLTLRPQDACE